MKSKTLPIQVPGLPRSLPGPDYFVEKPKPLDSYFYVPETPEHSSSSSIGPSVVFPESP